MESKPFQKLIAEKQHKLLEKRKNTTYPIFDLERLARGPNGTNPMLGTALQVAIIFIASFVLAHDPSHPLLRPIMFMLVTLWPAMHIIHYPRWRESRSARLAMRNQLDKEIAAGRGEALTKILKTQIDSVRERLLGEHGDLTRVSRAADMCLVLLANEQPMPVAPFRKEADSKVRVITDEDTKRTILELRAFVQHAQHSFDALLNQLPEIEKMVNDQSSWDMYYTLDDISKPLPLPVGDSVIQAKVDHINVTLTTLDDRAYEHLQVTRDVLTPHVKRFRAKWPLEDETEPVPHEHASSNKQRHS